LQNTDPVTISVIIPVYNSARTLSSALSALAGARPPPDEIVVVDDGSTDGSGTIASHAGHGKVIRIDPNVGAAAAKNRGARAARGDILFFTDADILAPTNIFARLSRSFQEGRCDAVVGMLDSEIPEHTFASQYKNLWMNYTYARLADRARIGLFYTSAAAIRRERFLALGGFDERYRGASVAEDTEFGQRAWSAGVSIRLDPSIQVVHLKAYTLSAVLREDIRRSAALTRMRLRKWGQPFFTSVPLSFQLGIASIYSALIAIALGKLYSSPLLLIAALFACVFFYALNLPFIQFLARLRGLKFGFQSCVFLPLDALVVGIGMLLGAVDFVRGHRY
jgi:GT2 family glycosyltransferase